MSDRRRPGFVHLHLHSHYSLLDSTIQLGTLADQVASMDMPAVAVTDHGNLFGAFEFHQQAIERGVRPVLGSEVYVAIGDHEDREPVPGRKNPYHHLVLLAENQTGWSALSRIVSEGYLKGFYYKPRVSKQVLADNAEGLIALSGCLSGEVAERLLARDVDGAVAVAEEYREIFGADNFFLEIQNHGSADEEVVREGMRRVSERTGLEVVATNDCHFHRRGDLLAHKVLIGIGRNRKLDELDDVYGYTEDFYVKTPEEMHELFGDWPGACERTVDIADRCHVRFDTGSVHLPSYPVPDGFTLDGYLEKVAEEGLTERIRTRSLRGGAEQTYRERLRHELDVVRKMGFPGYFLVVWDFIAHARDEGIPVGPGRGSAAGSLVSYALGITDIDPLEHGLLFERFLNPERISMPDIDIDFCQRRRDDVIEYVRDRYGRDSVCQIATFNILKARSAVRDVGRVMGLSFGDVDRIAKMIPEELGITLEQAVQRSPQLAEMMEANEEVRQLVDTAGKIEGLARHCGVHAAGVVIAPRPLLEMLPLYKTARDEVTTQFAKDEVEDLGLLKMDFLGLKTLTVISDALDSIERAEGERPDLENVPMDDPQVYALFASGDTDGIFQFESSGMKDMLQKVRPRQFSDLAALNALYRPGPMQFIDKYAARKDGREPVSYLFPELEEILGETYGIMVYQEQVMQIAVRIAGFSMGRADTLRKAMAKKKEELIAKLADEFIAGGVANGYPENKVRSLWEQIGPFAQYGFNKSHSVAYAHVAYLTGYLKAHYPEHFMAAMLTSEVGDTDKLRQHLEHTHRMGIRILPPDINASVRVFSVEREGVRFGLEALKGVGGSAVDALMAAREAVGGFTSVSHCLRSLPPRSLNHQVVESLAKAGCFDSLGLPRGPLVEKLEVLIDQACREREQEQIGQGFLFESLPSESLEAELSSAEEADSVTRLAWERDVLGFYFSGHPLDEHASQVERFADTGIADLPSRREDGWEQVAVAGLVTNSKERTTREDSRNPGRRWGEFRLEDPEGAVRVLVFADRMDAVWPRLEEDLPVLVVAGFGRSREGVELVAEDVIPLDGIERRRADALRIVLILDDTDEERLVELRELLLDHPGSLPVRFDLVRRGRFRMRLIPPPALRVDPSPALFETLSRRLGPGRAEFEFASNGGVKPNNGGVVVH